MLELTLIKKRAVGSLQRDVDPVRIVVIWAEVADRGVVNLRVNFPLKGEVACGWIKLLFCWGSLSPLNVAASKCFDLIALDCSIDIIYTPAVCVGFHSDVMIVLELPVRPPNEVLIGCIGKLLDLLLTRAIWEASSKLRDDEWDTKSFGIFISYINIWFMILFARFSTVRIWFTILTGRGHKCTAVWMVVQDVIGWTKFATWWQLEANREIESSLKWQRVRLWWRLEPHQRVLVILTIGLVNVTVKWGEVDSIIYLRKLKSEPLHWIANEWFIQWVIADYILVSGKPRCYVIPIGNKLVLKTLLVLVQSFPKVEALFRSVVYTEIWVLTLAIDN